MSILPRISTVAILTVLLGGGAYVRESTYALPPTDAQTQPSMGRHAAVGGQILTIPAETEAPIQILSGIHTRVNHVGDRIAAQLSRPVYVQGQVALPRGSLLEGRITALRAGRRLRRGGELRLRFETITLPDGQVRPISAILTALENPESLNLELDSEGELKGASRFPWKQLTHGFAGVGLLAGLQSQLVSAATLGATLPAGGGATLAYAFLWPRGNDVHIPPDTQLRIRLNHSLTVRLPW